MSMELGEKIIETRLQAASRKLQTEQQKYLLDSFKASAYSGRELKRVFSMQRFHPRRPPPPQRSHPWDQRIHLLTAPKASPLCIILRYLVSADQTLNFVNESIYSNVYYPWNSDAKTALFCHTILRHFCRKRFFMFQERSVNQCRWPKRKI